MIKVSPEPEKLKTILEGKFYQVPLYQREFAWEIDEVSALYYDIENSSDEGHFFGALLLAQSRIGNNKFEIIDGQQRLITLLLILASIRKILGNNKLDTYIFDVPETIADVKMRDLNPRFIANKRDNDLFEALMKGEDYKADKGKKSHKCLFEAYNYLYEKINEKKKEDGERGIVDFGDKILFKTFFIRMITETNYDKSLLFKTLNARGLELSQADLIKNEICRHLKKCSIEEAVTKWDDIREEIEESRADIDDFLFHHMNSLDSAQIIRKNLETRKKPKNEPKSTKTNEGMLNFYPPVPEKYLFDAYEYTLSKVQDTKTFLKDIKESASIYTIFSAPRIYCENDYAHPLLALKELGAVRCYPFLLHAYRVLDKREFRRLCKAIEILTFRHSTICQKDAKELEKFYYELRYKLKSKGNLPAVVTLIKKHESMTNEAQFKIAFHSATPKPSVSKFILCRIICEQQEPMYWKTKNVHLEHIMPKSPANAWLKLYQTDDDKDKYKGYLNRLGNLTILQGRKNIVNSNKNFSEKCKLYKESRLTMTKDIPKKWKTWNFSSIDGRQDEIYELGKNIWNTSGIK